MLCPGLHGIMWERSQDKRQQEIRVCRPGEQQSGAASVDWLATTGYNRFHPQWSHQEPDPDQCWPLTTDHFYHPLKCHQKLDLTWHNQGWQSSLLWAMTMTSWRSVLQRSQWCPQCTHVLNVAGEPGPETSFYPTFLSPPQYWAHNSHPLMALQI